MTSEFINLPRPLKPVSVPPQSPRKPPIKSTSVPSEVQSSPQTTCGGSRSTSSEAFLAVWAQQSLLGNNRKLFAGSALDYPRFMMEYQRSALNVKENPSMCQQILMSLLDPKGLPYKLVTPYMGDLDPESAAKGLNKMLEILRLTYGTGRKQSRAQLDRLKTRKKVSATEEGLIEFYSELCSYQAVMEKCGLASELDTEGTLKPLLLKLPDHLRHRWNALFDDDSEDSRPTFAQLLKVVRDEHRRKTRELNQWWEESRPTRDRISLHVNAAGVETGAGTSQDGASSHQNSACLCGSDANHLSMADCPAYKNAASRAAKWTLIRQHGQEVCFRCLKADHRANRCPSGECPIKGCKARHHPSLHNNAAGGNRNNYQRRGQNGSNQQIQRPSVPQTNAVREPTPPQTNATPQTNAGSSGSQLNPLSEPFVAGGSS